MIIFGYSSKPKVLGQFFDNCRNCKKKTVHGLVKVTTWFTLYFIPAIPLRKISYVVCSDCGAKNPLKKEAAKKMEEIAKQAKVAENESKKK